MITNEKELETHIVGDDTFCEFIEYVHELKDVTFAGRQVHIGSENIADIVYEGMTDAPEEYQKKVLIIVELKFAPLECKHFSQLGRYMSAVLDYADVTTDFIVKGILVGTGITPDVACMLNADMFSEDVAVCNITSQIEYHNSDSGWWTGAVNTNGIVSNCVQKFINELSSEQLADDGENDDERTA